MPMIDFRSRCLKCNSIVPTEELLKPCSVCGFDSLKEGEGWAKKQLDKKIRLQIENDKKMNAPGYEGPRFAGQLASSY